MERKTRFARIFAVRTAKLGIGAMRNASKVSFVCSRANDGFTIREPAKKNAIQRRPGPKRRASAGVGSKAKLKKTMMMSEKTTVAVSSSRVRNSRRHSFAKSVNAARKLFIGQASARMDS